jgi:hypothetical protein
MKAIKIVYQTQKNALLVSLIHAHELEAQQIDFRAARH